MTAAFRTERVPASGTASALGWAIGLAMLASRGAEVEDDARPAPKTRPPRRTARGGTPGRRQDRVERLRARDRSTRGRRRRWRRQRLGPGGELAPRHPRLP